MPQAAITLVLNRIPLFLKTTVKRWGETVPLKEEAKKAQSKVCFHILTNGQRNPVYMEMKCDVKAGSWEKLEISPTPHLTAFLYCGSQRSRQKSVKVLFIWHWNLCAEMKLTYMSSTVGKCRPHINGTCTWVCVYTWS